MGNKKKKQTKQTDRRIRGVIAVLVILILGVIIYGISSRIGGFHRTSNREPWLTSVSIGPEYGQIEKTDKKGDFRIAVSLPIDTDITQISCTLETSEGTTGYDAKQLYHHRSGRKITSESGRRGTETGSEGWRRQ